MKLRILQQQKNFFYNNVKQLQFCFYKARIKQIILINLFGIESKHKSTQL
jgi:hypothetical protein